MPTSNEISQAEQEASFLQQIRESIDVDVEEAPGKSEEDTLDHLTSIQGFCILFIKEASSRPAAEFETMQPRLDLLWQMFIRRATHCGNDTAFHDRLLGLLLWTKEFDSLCRSLHPGKSSEMTWESYGFASSLQASWQETVQTGIAKQLTNLATFSAKALALGVYGDSIGVIALWLLREALETDDHNKTTNLLSAAVIWMDHSRHKLFTFSILNKSCQDQANTSLHEPGPLFQGEDIDCPGFSLTRWLFWRRRFQQLSHDADLRVAKEAKKGFMRMINCGRDMGYDVPGEAKFAERLQKAMGEELIRSGKASVGGVDVHNPRGGPGVDLRGGDASRV